MLINSVSLCRRFHVPDPSSPHHHGSSLPHHDSSVWSVNWSVAFLFTNHTGKEFLMLFACLCERQCYLIISLRSSSLRERTLFLGLITPVSTCCSHSIALFPRTWHLSQLKLIPNPDWTDLLVPLSSSSLASASSSRLASVTLSQLVPSSSLLSTRLPANFLEQSRKRLYLVLALTSSLSMDRVRLLLLSALNL